MTYVSIIISIFCETLAWLCLPYINACHFCFVPFCLSFFYSIWVHRRLIRCQHRARCHICRHWHHGHGSWKWHYHPIDIISPLVVLQLRHLSNLSYFLFLRCPIPIDLSRLCRGNSRVFPLFHTSTPPCSDNKMNSLKLCGRSPIRSTNSHLRQRVYGPLCFPTRPSVITEGTWSMPPSLVKSDPGGVWSHNPLVKSQVLYQLSYGVLTNFLMQRYNLNPQNASFFRSFLIFY